MKGVLNETTQTVHKPLIGRSEYQTECGASNHLSLDQLRIVSVESSLANSNVTKCGRCFADAGGY
jgi:hypothetical protein